MNRENTTPTHEGALPSPAFDGDLEELWTPTKTAGMLGLTVPGLANLRTRGGGPKYVRLSYRCVRYIPRHVREYIYERIAANTAGEPGMSRKKRRRRAKRRAKQRQPDDGAAAAGG